METTLNVFNTTLYDRVVPDGVVLTSTRGMVAARMASTAREFADTFAKHNSGTYNNQWMAVDYNKLEQLNNDHDETVVDAFVVLEQAPGKIVIFDASAHLLEGSHWGSYNIPSDVSMFNLLGYQAMVDKFGDAYSHEHAPRANIFRRDAPGVVLQAAGRVRRMQSLMHSNDFKNDPLSGGSAGNAVSARFDLVPEAAHPTATGGIDSKVRSCSLSGCR
jgi:hypothetical protein